MFCVTEKETLHQLADISIHNCFILDCIKCSFLKICLFQVTDIVSALSLLSNLIAEMLVDEAQMFF